MEGTTETRARAPLRSELQHQAVAELGRLALEGCALQKLLDHAAGELSRCLDVRFVQFLELASDRSHLTLRAGTGLREGSSGAQVPADARSQAGFILRSEAPVFVQDMRTEKRFDPPKGLSANGIVGSLSVVVGPVDNPWGILGIHEDDLSRCGFDQHDADFVRSVANIVWLFIRNLRSSEEVEQERVALRSFADAMPIMFSVVNRRGRYEFVNSAYRDFGMEPAEFVGRRVIDVLGKAVYRGVEPHMEQALAGHVVRFENRIDLGDKGQRDILAIFAPRWAARGQTDGYYGAVVDITDQKRRQYEIQERDQQYQAIADSIPYGIWTCDAKGVLTHVSQAFLELVGMTFDEAADFGWLSRLLPEAAAETRAAWLACIAERCDWEREHRFVGSDGRYYDILAIARPVFDHDGELSGYVGLNLDITERKRREETLALISAELDHRVKNVFSLVISIARQASRSATDVDAFRDGFEGRLRALATAHQMISENEWQDMSLCRLIKAELAPYLSPEDARLKVEGPMLELPVGSVQPLALAFHELATNAAKYGALASPGGTLSVRWSFIEDGDLLLVWNEQGVEGVVAPDRTGFGSRVLKQVLVMQLGAEVSIEYRETGLKTEIRLPLQTARRV